MTRSGITFHHPVAFWLGTVALTGGVCAHLPMFIAMAPMGYRMAGMAVDTTMTAGMILIVLGLLGSVYGLVPRMSALTHAVITDEERALLLVTADNAPLTRAHGKVLLVLVLALVIDIMKPATLGFVIPGMSDEYGISKQTGSLLAFTALTGTALGSVIWGVLADRLGRRSAILISSLMFVGTSICGSMPSFEWNLFMCFLMGASAGGLLPIVFTLLAEIVPTSHRGWLLVLLGGLGTTGGYLAASAFATWLEPQFGWRILWFLNLPTGLALIIVNRYLPESPRFLVHVGKSDEARAMLARYGATVAQAAPSQRPPAAAERERSAMRLLFGPRIVALTVGLIVCGIAWGLVNFGFLLWLPTNLRAMGYATGAANALLAKSAVLALPGAVLVTWMYHRWSSFKTLALFICITAAALLGFFAASMGAGGDTALLSVLTIVLLISVSGVIAMLIPYATEIYPVAVRGTGSGVVAGSSKLGGIVAAGLGVLGLLANLGASAVVLALPLLASAAILIVKGIETRGRSLETIRPQTSAVPQTAGVGRAGSLPD